MLAFGNIVFSCLLLRVSLPWRLSQRTHALDCIVPVPDVPERGRDQGVDFVYAQAHTGNHKCA
jgi:hypothetical protein